MHSEYENVCRRKAQQFNGENHDKTFTDLWRSFGRDLRSKLRHKSVKVLYRFGALFIIFSRMAHTSAKLVSRPR